jgi:protein-arginine kinase activator protein McsA
MAYSLAEYIATAAARDNEHDSLEKCQACGVPLQEAIYGYRRVGDGAECSDCYFDDFSEQIDAHPVGRLMSRVSGT